MVRGTAPHRTICRGAAAVLLASGFVLWTGNYPAYANNGLNFIGSGLESNAMAGADLGVARDPLALNTNLARLAQLHGIEIEQHFGVARALDVGLHDFLDLAFHACVRLHRS